MAPQKITDRQRQEVLRYLQEGLSNAEIAEKVGITARQVAAVKAHVTMATYHPISPSESPLTVASPEQSLSEDIPSFLTIPESPISIPVGKEVATGQELFWNPDPASGSSNPHLMVIGKSGLRR